MYHQKGSFFFDRQFSCEQADLCMMSLRGRLELGFVGVFGGLEQVSTRPLSGSETKGAVVKQGE